MNTKKLDQIVHSAVEETLEEMGDQIAARVKARLVLSEELANHPILGEDKVPSKDRISRPHKMFNPEAGP